MLRMLQLLILIQITRPTLLRVHDNWPHICYDEGYDDTQKNKTEWIDVSESLQHVRLGWRLLVARFGRGLDPLTFGRGALVS